MVDAGMRCLWATGWIHQSVRMVTASFLVEYLGVSWVEGARWYHDTLVDADVAINAMMWQVLCRCTVQPLTLYPALLFYTQFLEHYVILCSERRALRHRPVELCAVTRNGLARCVG